MKLLHSDFVHPHSRDDRLRAGRVLGVVNFSTSPEAVGAPYLSQGVPTVDLPMAPQTADGFAEVWSSSGPTTSGWGRDLLGTPGGDLVYAHDDEYLFCAGHVRPTERFGDATRAAYLSAFELAHRLEFPRLFRMWNFVGGINDDNAEGLEVYRDFCRGRSEAFESYRQLGYEIPAATGIGSRGAGITFFFLSCRSRRTTQIENPRQMPAYHYPTQYGPRSPSFARASHVGHSEDGSAGQIYISGTASIIGHETVHSGDLDKQCATTFDNLSQLIDAENLSRHGIPRGYRLDDIQNVKVYVRNEDDIPQVRHLCRQVFSSDADIQYLNVDICRSDLLVEIEGILPAPEDTT